MTDDAAPSLPPRPDGGHKGVFGTVAVIGGAATHTTEDAAGVRMPGAPALTALAALRAGAGLARIVAPEPILNACLLIAPGATGVPLAVDDVGAPIPHLAAAAFDEVCDAADCLAVGPGLGRSAGAQTLVLRALASETPVILDADGLNNLAAIPDAARDIHAPAILTPHPGEYRRLADAFGVDVPPDDHDAAGALARRLGAIVVLKSSRTVVSDGLDDWTFDNPNPALGTAGSGDVLTGVIAALVARLFPRGPRIPGFDPPGAFSLYNCARLGVRLHAEAGRLWAADHPARGGMLATDLVDRLPDAADNLTD
ncbi:MAG: NAD(P)H-hydrate dehydratase [Phycisphaerales bacterium]